MGISGLLNQTATLYNRSSYGADGREAFGTGSTVRIRMQPKGKRMLMPDGSIYTIDAIAFVRPDEVLSTDDKIVYNNVTYKVVDIYLVPGRNGITNHQELKLIKWQ